MSDWVSQTVWPWLVEVTLKGAIISALAWLIYWLTPRRMPFLRRGIVFSLFHALLILTIIAGIVRWPSHLILLAPQPPTVPIIVSAPLPAVAPSLGHEQTHLLPRLVDAYHPAAPATWPIWVCGVWLIGCLVSLFPTLHGLWLLRQAAKHASPVTAQAVLATFDDLHDPFGRPLKMHPLPTLLHADTAEMPAVPMTWGILRPVILLPQDFETWDDARLRAVLSHECAHIVAWDWLSLLEQSVLCGLYWPNPLVWWATRQARYEAERTADQFAVSQGISVVEYAASLVAIARACRPSDAWTAAIPMVRPSHLAQRVTSILEWTKTKLTWRMFFISGCLSFLILYPASLSLIAKFVIPVGARPDARIQLDAQTEAVMRQTMAATASLRTFSADLQETTTFTNRPADRTQTLLHAFFERPNLARIDSPGETFVASGGETWSTFDDPGQSYHYHAHIAPDGSDMTADDYSQPLVQFFFKPDYYRLGGYLITNSASMPIDGVDPGPIPVHGRYLGMKTWQGEPCQVLEFTRTFTLPDVTTVYIGPDHLVRRIVGTGTFYYGVRTDDLVLKNVRVDPTLPSALFTRPSHFPGKDKNHD